MEETWKAYIPEKYRGKRRLVIHRRRLEDWAELKFKQTGHGE
jgi:hypothetical protein